MSNIAQLLSGSPARQFREQLLSATLLNALRTSFYQQRFAGIDVSAVGIDDLHRLPIVNKDDLRIADRRAQVRSGLICSEIFTSATTGPAFVSARGHIELEYIRNFYNTLYSNFEIKQWARGLQINNPFHGNVISIPAPIHFHCIGIYDRGSFEYGREVLIGEHDDFRVEPRCTLLVGLERMLRAFAYSTRAEYPKGLECHLKYIFTAGQYLSQFGRRLLEETFNAKVLDRYSMSEVFGGATEANECGWYFFDPPIIPEVVTPDSNVPINEGVGILLVTALFPFQEAQPLIRYYTGDIVQVTHTESSRPGELAIKPLGREKYSLPKPDHSGWILTPAEVYEAIDETAELKRSPLFRDSADVENPYIVGHPRYNITFDDCEERRNIVVNIELEPNYLPNKNKIAADLRHRILANSPCATEMLDQGACSLEVVVTENFPAHIISYRE